MSAAARPWDILLVEDNPGDVRLTQEAFSSTRVSPRIHVAPDGETALEFLEGVSAGESCPDLILLDLNLPRIGGREILRHVKNDERLRTIPVIVLTTSDADQDVRAVYELHGNAFVVKPVDFYDFIAIVQSIESFWLESASLSR